MVRASWSMKEFQQAVRMKRRGATYADIAAALGRATAAVEAKLTYKSPVKLGMATRTPEVPTCAIDEQFERNAARHPDLTSVICGDPAAGHSAMDREGGGSPARRNGHKNDSAPSWRHSQETIPAIEATRLAGAVVVRSRATESRR